MSRGGGRHRSSSSHDANFRQHPSISRGPRERERRDFGEFRRNARSSQLAERERHSLHRRTFSAPGRGEPLLRSPQILPRPDSLDRRDGRLPPKGFDPGSRSNMHQIKVTNLFIKRGHIDDRHLKIQVHQAFARFGKCSAYVEHVAPGDDAREAYITYWSPDHCKLARREGDGIMMNGRRLEVTVVREPKIFTPGSGNGDIGRPRSASVHGSPGRSESRRDSRDSGNSMSSQASLVQGRLTEDDTATRTLFVGNLPAGVALAKVREHFERIGPVHDVDLKRARHGNVYAFVKYVHRRDARRAKLELQGSLIMKSRIHLGYGRGTPGCRVYIYNLGRWANKEILEQTFKRYGTVRNLEYRPGSTFAVLEYDSVDSSRAALHLKRVKTPDGGEYPLSLSYIDAMDLSVSFGDVRGRASTGNESTEDGRAGDHGPKDGTQRRSAGMNEEDPVRDYKHSDERTSRGSKREHSQDREEGHKRPCVNNGAAGGSESLVAISQRCPVLWRGCLALRGACCPVRFLLLDGNAFVAETLLGGLGVPRMILSQKMQLETSKLEEVMGGLSDGSYCWLLGLPTVKNETKLLQTKVAAYDQQATQCSSRRNSNMSDRESSHQTMCAGGPATATDDVPTDCDSEKTTSANLTSPEMNRTGNRSANSAGGCENEVAHTPDAECSAPGPVDTNSNGQIPHVQWRPLINFVNYMRAKQCAGIAHVRATLPSSSPGTGDVTGTKSTGVLHVFPPSQFADEQMAALKPSLSTPVDGVLLCLLVVRT